MALINCPECGKEFSDKAVSCPNCAYPLTNTDRIRLGIIDGAAALKQAEESCREGNYSNAYETYYALAQKGDIIARYRIGVMLLRGEGVEKNEEMGIDFLVAAANSGNSEAMLQLAAYYEKKNKETSFEWYNRCLENIEKFEKNTQGEIYKELGILCDDAHIETKIDYLGKAMDLGADVKREYAEVMLRKGQSLLEQENFEESREYLFKAKELGKIEADEPLGRCYFELGKKLENKEEKIEMLRKASLYNNEEAKKQLSDIYYEMAVENRSIDTLELASYLGNENAMEKLATIFNNKGADIYSPDGEMIDIAEAVNFFSKSKNLGNEEARKNLAAIYNQLGVDFYNGENGREIDFIQSEQCFKNAIEMGSVSAKANLGTLYNQYGLKYRDGKNAKVNMEQAEKFFLKAMNLGNKNAKKNLMMGYINSYFRYKHGVGGYICDPLKANEFLNMARDLDSEMLKEIGKDYYKRAKELTLQGINYDNYKKINSYLKRASKLGAGDLTDDLIAFYKLISLYYKKGKNGFTKSKNKSNIYMRKAAELGDREALKKYKPTKHSKKGKEAFERFTGINTTAIKKSTKGK